ncbi:MAG TPA: DUF3072 domain-containing protein [Stellaceae bacterium]|nr:DUF3072 domain-containing protein [Stellaceae bacterium]
MAAGKTDDPTRPGSGGDAPDTIKQPKDWVTGEDPMTPAQAAYLKRLSEQAGEPFDPDLTKAQASERIDRLRQAVTARGRSPARRPSRPSE